VTDFSAADWQRLRALRQRFLENAREAYWTPEDLPLYDATFAQRIGWKWDGVLRELDRIGWKPQSARVVDWGCGTGIAGRAIFDWVGGREFELFDQTPAAARFAAEALTARGAAARVVTAPDPRGALFVVSHVLGELDEAEAQQVADLAAAADEVLWVEPGARAVSRRLVAVHDRLLAGGHRVVAPCTHAGACPMAGAAGDWCHFFTDPPAGVFHSPFWRTFSETLEIDLRALPFSYLATSRVVAAPAAEGAERVIGRPRRLKAHCELLCCGAEGLVTRTLQKRDAPALFKAFDRGRADTAYRWDLDPRPPHRIRGGTKWPVR
jgi:hypothetical protein